MHTWVSHTERMFFLDDIFLGLTAGNHAIKEQWFSERIFRFDVRILWGSFFRIKKTMNVKSAQNGI